MFKKPSKPPEPVEPAPGGNEIQNYGNQSANAAGNRAWAWVVNITGEIKWQPVVIVLALVGAVLGVILYYVVPRTASEMTGLFNVAVAEFPVQGPDGARVNTRDGRTMADYLRQQIETQFAAIQLDKIVSYQVWGPEQTGIIQGKTKEDRAAAAEARARRIHAHVLIYGLIVSDGSNSHFMPEFYINHGSFADANEITGENDLGSRLRISLPLSDSIQAIENPALAGRVNALDLITIGLAYYSVDRFEQALTYFEQAAGEDRWVDGGKEVVYLLIGNSYIRQDSQTQDFSDLASAGENYRQALQENPGYSRAMIGQANVLYLTASQDKNNCDLAGLDQASELLKQAESAADRPPGANIDTKVQFYRGQIAIIRAACHQAGEDWLAVAQDQFSQVTSQYETRKQKGEDSVEIESLAAHAYARLGYIAYKRQDPAAAIAWIDKAVPIASPYYQALYTSLAGDIYESAHQTEQARQAYRDAIEIAATNGDGTSVKEYKAKLQKIEGQ
jgi:tetratricopeptide (TPR) repeat protein